MKIFFSQILELLRFLRYAKKLVFFSPLQSKTSTTVLRLNKFCFLSFFRVFFGYFFRQREKDIELTSAPIRRLFRRTLCLECLKKGGAKEFEK